jgi:chlorophyllide a reductase subunit Y
MAARPADAARLKADAAGKSERWRSMPPTIRRGRTISRRACARPSARCASACACGAPHVLSGSACCVYGLTFTSHFYGARRSVGYVPFNSERWSPASCSRTSARRCTSWPTRELRRHRRHQPVRAHRLGRAAAAPAEEINGVRIIGIDVPGFGVPTHAEAKDVLAGAMLRYARNEAEQGPVQAPRGGRSDRPTSRCSARCSRPIRSASAMLEPLGLAAGPVVPTREWRELYAALDCAVVAAIHPFYTASFREFRRRAADRRLGAGRRDGTEAWLEAIGAACGVARPRIDAAKNRPAGDPWRARGQPMKGRITLSGYEGSELLVARLLVESGADLRYVGTACPRTAGRAADREWLEAKGVHVQFRASLEQDLAALAEFRPTSRSARRRSCRRPRSCDSGALLHQPDFGAAADGPGRRRLAGAGRQRRVAARRASTR